MNLTVTTLVIAAIINLPPIEEEGLHPALKGADHRHRHREDEEVEEEAI